jgi:[NiFe] hydrogenase assembly HybE family chaperone
MFDPMTVEDAARIRTLVQTFTRIGDEQMRDIGLYNHDLAVESVGFRRWEDWLAGILVTPWFMNFIMLPTQPGQITGAVTDRVRMDLPRGEIKFTIGEVDGIGLYLSSSLYSPMDRFDVQGVAVVTAQDAVDKFFKVPEMEEPQACNERVGQG